MTEATPVIASLRRFSKIGRVSGEKCFKVLVVVDIAIADGLLIGREHVVCELGAFEQRVENEIALVRQSASAGPGLMASCFWYRMNSSSSQRLWMPVCPVSCPL